MYAQAGGYTDLACDDGSLWRWRKVQGWRLLAVVPGSAAYHAVQSEGKLDGYAVQPNE